MRVHIVMHESFEAPAAIESWLEKKGCTITFTRLYEGGELPKVFDFDFLIVMGGPQSPATTTDECPYFDAPKETAFIRSAIEQDKYVIGVCLGAQLIGEALGAKFEHSPNREIGVFPIMITEDGKHDNLIGPFPETFLVGHWHGDMPGLTQDSKILAQSEGCPRQIIRYNPRTYGFQCHFEFTLQAVQNLIDHSTAELDEYKGLPYVETQEQLKQHDYSSMNDLLFGFLSRLTETKAREA